MFKKVFMGGRFEKYGDGADRTASNVSASLPYQPSSLLHIEAY